MKYTCMVVEDEILIRKNLLKKLKLIETPFTVIDEASNGQEALEKYLINPVDLVITDIKMPVMDGIELCRELSKRSSKAKVLIISGYNDFSYAQKAIRYRAWDYLLKPIETDILTETLNGIAAALDIEALETEGKGSEALSLRCPEDPLVNSIRAYISENFHSNITVNEIANHFHFTVSYLVKIFRVATGQTPLQYLIYLRINEAKRLLMQRSDLSVSEIGQAVGYDDPHYFSRIFKKQTGISPSAYGIHSKEE